MKRRTFIRSTTVTSFTLALPSLVLASSKETPKIGVIFPIFNLSGYSKLQLKSLVQYSNFKSAYADLQSGKISALISSPYFIASEHPEYSLFGSFSMGAAHEKDTWVSQNYNYIADFHAQNEIKTEFLGSMSPLMVRLSNVTSEQLAGWKKCSPKIRLAASGTKATWFEILGFKVKSDKYLLKLTGQLADISKSVLDISNAYSPALFLQSLKMNEADGFTAALLNKKCTVFIDDQSNGSLPLEILYKNEKSADVAALKKSIQAFIKDDIKVQNAALEILVEQTGNPAALPLPAEMRNGIIDFKKLYMQTLAQYNVTAEKIVKKLQTFVGA